MRVSVKIIFSWLIPYNQVGRERTGMGNGAKMTINGVVRLWPTDRVIISIQAIFMQENFAITAEQGLRDVVLVGTGNKMSAIQDECPSLAVCRSNSS